MLRIAAAKSAARSLLAVTGWLAASWFTPCHGAPGEIAPPLPLFHAVYTLERNGIELGTSTRSLRAAADGSYIYESSTQASGVIAWFVKDQITEYSRWTLRGAHLRPLEYVYNRDGGSKTRHVKLDFNWQQNTVTNTIDGVSWRMAIPPDAQDKMIYQMDIMYSLLHGNRKLNYRIVDGGKKISEYNFEILGEEMLDTDLGRLNTLHIQRIGDKRGTQVWCAPQLSYLPVRLVQQDTDGSELTMQIVSVQGIAQPRFKSSAR